jgi:dynein heavy chain
VEIKKTRESYVPVA